MGLKFELILRLECSAHSRQRKDFHSVVAEANQGNYLTEYSLSDHRILESLAGCL